MVGFFGFLDLDFGPRNIVSRSGLRTCPGRRPTEGVLSAAGRALMAPFWIGADHSRAEFGANDQKQQLMLVVPAVDQLWPYRIGPGCD